MCCGDIMQTWDVCPACSRRVPTAAASCGAVTWHAQADIDAAFRRVPILPAHRWACGVAFVVGGKVRGVLQCMHLSGEGLGAGSQVIVSKHISCPFGAVGSVHAWERIGAAVAHLARVYLKLAILRYVDDYFCPERPAPVVKLVAGQARCVYPPLCGRPNAMKHALGCFARLVRLLLGPTALADQKMEFGLQIGILGVEMRLSSAGFQCCPSKDKVCLACVVGAGAARTCMTCADPGSKIDFCHSAGA